MGLDPSINSTGIVILNYDTEKIMNYILLNRKPTKFKDNIHVRFNGKFKNTEQGRIDRLDRFKMEFNNILLQYKPELVFMEDYSFGSKGRSIIHNAEIIGALKLSMYNLLIPYIPIDPSTVKMFVSKGNSSKEEVMIGVNNIYDVNFDDFDLEDGGNDLYDAFTLSMMALKYEKIKENSHYDNLTNKEIKVLNKPRKMFKNTSLLQEIPVIKGAVS